MEKITKKEFIAILENNKTVFAGCPFQWSDEKCIAGMNRIEKIPTIAERRTVTEKHADYIVFSNGSRLDIGHRVEKLTYFTHTNPAGIRFVVQRMEWFDDFDNKTCNKNLVYMVV